MSGRFFDSNILLYLASDQQERVDRVRALMESGGAISVQVMNEMASVCRRKFGMTWSATAALISEAEGLLLVVPVTMEIHRDGLRLAARYGLAVYDSFIVAAALATHCDTLWSEDMQDGMVVDGRLTISNPFRNDPSLIPAS